MNQNDSKSDQPKYPLANAPGSELQQMSYKDSMDRCVDDPPVLLSGGYSTSIEDALSTSINIATAFLSLTNPIAGFAGSLTGILFNFLWPTNTQAKWEAFIKAVEELVDQKIEEYAQNQAISRLVGVQNVLQLYQVAVDALQKDPNNAVLREHVREQFIATNTFIVGSMPLFRVKGQEVPMLTMFTEAANLHLLLLRDAAMFGTSWDMSPVTEESYQRDLENALADYTDHCVNTYNSGLKKAHELPPNYDYKSSKFPWIPKNLKEYTRAYEEGYWRNVIDWNYYNNYRRDMTIMVLDIVALWPTYNPKLYPEVVKMELTRELYSELMGQGWNENQDKIESLIVRPPHLFTWLQTIKIGTMKPQDSSKIDQYADIRVILHMTNSNNTWEEVPVTAAPRSGETVYTNDAFGRVELSGTYSPYMFRFYNPYNGGGHLVGTDVPSVQCHSPHNTNMSSDEYLPYIRWYIETEIPSDTLPHSHRLSYVDGLSSALAGFNYKVWYLSAWVFAWTHAGVDPNNTIVSDKITQIPAVKGYLIDHGATVVRGPGSTGGDLVKLPEYNQQWTQLRIMVRPSSSARKRSFTLRIRYASQSGANLFVGKYVDATNRYYETGNYAVNSTFSGSMTYSSFKYLDTFVFGATEEEFKIELRCNNGGPIFIDRIEFIPREPVEDIQAPQPLPYTYQIFTALNNRSVVDMDPGTKNVHLWENGNAANQKWKVVYDSSKKEYQIKNIANENLVLTWDDLVGSNNVIAAPNQQLATQYWIIADAGSRFVYLKNKKDPYKVLDVSGGGTENGRNIIVWNYTGGINQKFRLDTGTGTLAAQIESLYHPQSGQKSRSSNNFSLNHLAEGTRVGVRIEGEGFASLSFNIARDVSGGTDRTIWSNVCDDYILTIPSGDNSKLYIANPSGYTSNGTFLVKFYAL